MKSKVEEEEGRDKKGRFTKQRGKYAAAPSQQASSVYVPQEATIRPIVRTLPPNQRLVLCDVGPYRNVRVMVRPNNQNYIPRMVIPLDVDLTTFNPAKLLIYNGNPPRRKGWW